MRFLSSSRFATSFLKASITSWADGHPGQAGQPALDAGAVTVEDLLQKLGGLALDFQLAVGNGGIDFAIADNLAHGGFRRVANQGRRRADIKKILYRIAGFYTARQTGH